MKNIRIYIGFTAAYWIALAVLLMIYGYRESFLVLNQFHGQAWDYLMYFLTWFGDSLFISSLIVLIFPRNISLQMMIILSVAVSGLLVQVLKQWIFSGWDRPLKVFEGEASVHIIGNYQLFHRSFPSGHSVTTGAAFTLLAWYLREKKLWVIVCGLMTMIVSYTRIYTGSHFPGDVLVGSILGTGISILAVSLYEKRLRQWTSAWPSKTIMIYHLMITLVALGGLFITIYKYISYL